ncbi:MAG: hypothetical protein LC802_14830 [Acidobacteria bacterium]|nr:hypothetical protein [Acidobacteriota bacterium]
MSTSDQDQPQAQDQEQTRDGGSQSHTAEGGAADRAGRHGGGGGGRGRRRGGSGGGGRLPQQQQQSPQQQQQQQGQQRRPDSSLNMEELRELTELFTAHAARRDASGGRGGHRRGPAHHYLADCRYFLPRRLADRRGLRARREPRRA